MSSHAGFYEDDEPVDEIAAAFEQGIKGVTAPPREEAMNLSNQPQDTATSGAAEVWTEDDLKGADIHRDDLSGDTEEPDSDA